MGLTSLPEVGAGEALGPVKQDKPLAYPDSLREILAAEHNAAMAALEAVCAEVGLHDGSTPGSLVERVTDLEAGGGGTGDVVGPASAVNNNLAAFNTTTGKLIKDSGVAISAIATAQAAAEDAQDAADAAAATANLAEAKIKTIQFLSTYPGDVVSASTNGRRTFCSVAGADFGLGIQDDCVVGHEQWIMRTYTGTTDPGGSVIVVDAGTATHIIGGTDRIDTAFRWMCLRCYAYDSGTNTRYWTLEEESVPVRPTVRAAHTSSTLTLTADRAGTITPLDGTSNAIAITIPHSLFLAASGVAGGPLARSFECGFDVTSVAGGAITFTGSGGLSIKYHGKKPSSTAIAAGDSIVVSVVSATLAHVYISAEIP